MGCINKETKNDFEQFLEKMLGPPTTSVQYASKIL
jgi:hypothetical protein